MKVILLGHEAGGTSVLDTVWFFLFSAPLTAVESRPCGRCGKCRAFMIQGWAGPHLVLLDCVFESCMLKQLNEHGEVRPTAIRIREPRGFRSY
jgi:hypothetical protein